ncbi:MAG: hypothetical protein M5R36_05445 [Deltaproteobacteria bacterium]|nr:hypothetical protein [Deltaproteobacteria bacterium]
MKSALAALLIGMAVMALACGDLEEEEGDAPDITPHDDENDGADNDDVTEPWEYPYYLIIGGGVSETLSVLTINGPGEFSLANDVQLTGPSISETEVAYGKLFAVCSLSHSVIEYALDDLDIETEIGVGAGSNPLEIAFRSASRAYLPAFQSNDVRVIDPGDDAGEPLAVIPLPAGDELPSDGGETWARPGSAEIAGGKLFVALSNLGGAHTAGGPGLLAVIDPDENVVTRVIELEGRDAAGMFLDRAADRLYVLSLGDYDEGFVGNGKVERVDPAGGTVEAVIETGGSPAEMTVASDGIAYLANARRGSLLRFDPSANDVLPEIDLPTDDGLSYASAVAADGNGFLYVSEFNGDGLFVLDLENGAEIVGSFTVNDGPDTLSFIR